MEKKREKRLGEILLEDGILTRDSLTEALQYQKENGGLIGQVLIQLGYLTEEELVGALGRQLRLPYIPLASYSVNMDATRLLDEDFCRHHMVIVFDKDEENRLHLAISDPMNRLALEEINRRHAKKVQIFISTPSEIMSLCDLAFSGSTEQSPKRRAG